MSGVHVHDERRVDSWLSLSVDPGFPCRRKHTRAVVVFVGEPAGRRSDYQSDLEKYIYDLEIGNLEPDPQYCGIARFKGS